ncbi:MAG: hypothetical protein NVS1B1_00240 [Candidatus Limnocylindrales bacterium]
MKPVNAPASLGIGALGGLIGISCCVSPVVLYLIGVASATEAVGLGTRLYGEYAWYFRGAGLLVGGGAVAIYLRRQDQCDLRGARTQWRTIVGAAAVGVVTYAALYALTTWLGTRAHA